MKQKNWEFQPISKNGKSPYLNYFDCKMSERRRSKEELPAKVVGCLATAHEIVHNIYFLTRDQSYETNLTDVLFY